MQSFERDIYIDRPVSEVFDALCRLDQLPVWNPRVMTIQRTSGDSGPARVGTSGVVVANVLGRRIETGVRYSRVVPDRLVAIETTSGPFRITGRATVEPAGPGTILRTTWTGEASGMMRFVEGRLVNGASEQVTKALETLKHLLESTPARTSLAS
jgi:carbon monoxide dehydrogenase subunit G